MGLIKTKMHASNQTREQRIQEAEQKFEDGVELILREFLPTEITVRRNVVVDGCRISFVVYRGDPDADIEPENCIAINCQMVFTKDNWQNAIKIPYRFNYYFVACYPKKDHSGNIWVPNNNEIESVGVGTVIWLLGSEQDDEQIRQLSVRNHAVAYDFLQPIDTIKYELLSDESDE